MKTMPKKFGTRSQNKNQQIEIIKTANIELARNNNKIENTEQ